MAMCKTPDNYELVLDLFEEAKNAGIKPDEAMYTQAIAACEMGASRNKGIAAERYLERAQTLIAMREGKDVTVSDGANKGGNPINRTGASKQRAKKAGRRLPGV